jgi:hypothetical protein
VGILNKGKPKPKHMKPRRRWRTSLTALGVKEGEQAGLDVSTGE